MKRIATLFVLFTLCFSSYGQKSYVNYDRDSKWFFGLNAGATWHNRTEVKNLINAGYGLTFGRSFGMRPEKLFSWDLRFRYLHGYWKGQSTVRYLLNDSSTTNLSNYSNNLQTYQDTTGYFVPNFKTELFSGSIELALNTNRLRQNTGWNLQIFGGIGAKAYTTATDLYDGSGSIYDYNNASSMSQTNLLSLQDNEYETYLVGSDGNYNWTWMPSFGAGISYQITPWASIGISHKMTWTRTNDQFDGMPNVVTTGTSSGFNDVYHYSSAGIRFHILGKATPIEDDKDEDITDVNNFDNTTDPVVTPTPDKKPIVDIYDPGVSPYTTELDHFIIRADVFHVDGKQNITFKQNGNINNNFSYNPTSNQFESNVVLQAGQNIFEITATNDAGQDYESTIIIHKRDEPVIEPPIVSITNPPYSPYTTSNNTFNFSGTVLNVDSKSQIKVYLNGAYLPNFTYESTTKAIYATLNLQEGTNTVLVTATNDAGSDSKKAEIIFDKPEQIQPPIVDFINPSSDPYHTSIKTHNVTASVLNVKSKNNITVKINGHPTTNFSFNNNTKRVNFVANLNEGANIISVSGTNEAGTDQETTTIFYNKPEVPKPPIVTYLNPILDPLVVYSSNYNVKAKVEHVDGISGIKLKINGNESYNFAYSASSEIMTFSTNLLPGSNVIQITGTNNVGQDVETTTIIYRKVEVQTPPEVDITYPVSDNQQFNSPHITLTANVLNVNSSSNIKVKVNGNQTVGFNYNTSTKVLALPLTLNEGSNTVVITGTNSAGSDSDTRIVLYKKPVTHSPPTVEFVNPPSSPHLSNTDNYTLTASTTNIDSKSQINLLVNGMLVPDVAYTFTSNHQIIYNANLIQGSNVLEVQVSNNDGADDDMAIVTYEEPDDDCIIPTIGYISPVPYSTVNDPNIIVDAQINNHTNDTKVELLVNGTSLGFMGYNSNSSIASLAATLVNGSNGIEVIATNDCGTNRSTFTLNYQPAEIPCTDPDVNAIGQTNFTTQDEKVDLTAGVSEISSSNDIDVTLNGNNINFQFDQGTNTISIDDINLALGNNTVIIEVENDCGSETITYHIIREKCDLPVISNSAYNNGYTSSINNLQYTINISNVTSNQVELIVNGISQAFSYNEQSGVLSSSINLAEGVNQVLVKASNACGDASSSYTFNYEIPCQVINYSLLSPSTTSATVTDENYNISFHVSGSMDPSGITATHNGQSVNVSLDTISGEANISGLTLVDGTNTIKVELKNDCSEKSINYSINYEGCKPPTIDLQGISSGAVVNSPNLNLVATILNSNGANNIQLEVNGATQSFDFNESTNTLTAGIGLTEGTNSISFTINGCETVSESIDVIYEIPCQDISHNLLKPTTNSKTVVNADYEISLNLLEVSSQQQITVKHNGNAIPFTFLSGTQLLVIDGITLVEGANTIEVIAVNDCSQETITYNIQYEGCQPPTITLGNNPSSVGTENYTFNATVTNIDDQSQLQLFLNNGSTPFVFNSQNGGVSADLTLVEGQNTIKLVANGCESVDQTINVVYDVPCDTIVVAFNSPSQAETSVANENYQISLIAQHADPSSISVTLNGNTVPHNYSNNNITIPNLTLIDGDNTIVVNMSNDCSAETVTYTIHHDGCDAPTIDFSGNADAVTSPNYNLSVQVGNIDSQNDLNLTHNGNPVNFNFNASTGELTASLTLTEGTNNLSLTANGCATASSDYSITYSIPCDPVTYSLGSPAQLSSVVNSETTSISLSVQNVNTKSDISVKLNNVDVPFTFVNNVITISNIQLDEGNNQLIVAFGNECSNESLTYNIESNQCESPIISVANNNMTTNNPIYTFTCTVQNISDGNDIQVSVNGQQVNSTFNSNTSILTAQITLQEGSNDVTVTANGCTQTSVTYTVSYEVPCEGVSYSFKSPSSLTANSSTDSYGISVATSNINDPSKIKTTLNGAVVQHTFNAQTGDIDINNITLVEGDNNLSVKFSNDCSNEELNYVITYSPQPCGPRFNPGNSEWQFCLVTPSGTYNRNDLANNSTFTYSGPATSAYFKPIAGGGDAIVGGQPYPVQNGAYYLFEGNLTVDVSSSHPGSMGHWEICIQSDNSPIFGNGNNRPTSPCEQTNNNNGQGGNNSNGNNDTGFEVGNDGTVHTDKNFCATIKCLGESVVYNNNEDAYVSLEYSIDGGSSWYAFNNNNNVSGGEQLEVKINSGSDVVLRANCQNQSGNWSNSETSNTGSQYVYVLKDGDNAPNFAPAQGQASVETFLSGYVDGNGNVTLGSNDVIYLFELRHVGNYGVDYQDCVMLITFDEGSNCPPPSNPSNGNSNSSNNNSGNNSGGNGNGNGRGNDNDTNGNNRGDGNDNTDLKPEFSRIQPSGSVAQSKSPSFRLTAKVTNVSNSSAIKMYVNGKLLSNLSFNASTGLISANLTLKPGMNTIQLTAQNGTKSSDITYKVNYEAVKKPVINNVNPAGSSVKSNISTYSFKAKVLNVKSKSDINVYLNGKPLQAFVYSSSTKNLTAVLRLNSGTNTVKVVAQNGSEKAEKSYTITYSTTTLNNTTITKPNDNNNSSTKTKKPVITNVSPKTSSATVKTATYMFKAKVSGVSSKSNIKFYVNGKATSGFTYNSTTKEVVGVVRLNPGMNTIKLVATNGNQRANQSYKITYSKTVKTNTRPINTNNNNDDKKNSNDSNSNNRTKPVKTNTNSNENENGNGNRSNTKTIQRNTNTNSNTSNKSNNRSSTKSNVKNTGSTEEKKTNTRNTKEEEGSGNTGGTRNINPRGGR